MAEEQVGVKVNVQVKGTPTLKSLKQEIKEAQNQALALSRQFGELSPQAIAATARVAELRDEMADLNERVELADPGKKFAAFGNAVAGVASGFTAAQGALATFGAESKDLEKTLVKLQGAMALSEGLSGIADSWKDFQRLGSVIKTQVVKAFSTLKGAIIATGIGALIVALGLIIANFEEIDNWLKKVIPGFEGLGKVFDNLKAAFSAFGTGVIETLKGIGDIIGNIFTGDFSGAVKAATELGERVGGAYVKAVEREANKIKIAEFASKRRQQVEDLENDITKIEAKEGKKRYDLRLQANSKLQDALAAEGKWDTKEMASALAERDNLLREQSQEAGQKALKALQDRQALTLQDLQNHGKDTLGVRSAQLQEQLALEKKYGLDTAATVQEIKAQAKADEKDRFDTDLKDLEKQQDQELQIAEIAGKNLFDLKQLQLDEQKGLYNKYGQDLKVIQEKQAALEIERRKTLNDALQKEILKHTENNLLGLVNVGAAQAKLNSDNADAAAKGQEAIDNAEKRKQEAYQATQNIVQGVVSSNVEASELEQAAAAAAAIAIEISELGKMTAIQATMAAVKIASKLMGEQSALGKGVAIANTSIDTVKSASSIFVGMTSQFPGPVGVALGVAGAAAAVIAGLARVKQITAIKIPGASGGGGAPNISMAPPVIPMVQGNSGAMVQQLGQMNTNLQQPTRVFVLESDITDTQDRVAKIEANAQF